MKLYKLFSKGSKINQIICAVLINLPVLSYGASIGWMSPMTLLLQSENSPRGVPLTDAEISIIAAIPYLVCMPSNLMIAVLADKVGRKIALIIISLASAASWILLLSSFEIWALILARALVGVTMSGCYVTCPIYTKEISDDSIRGALGCLVILFHTTGNLFLYIIGDLLSYNQILWICLTIPAVHLVAFIFMPDSPSFLVKKGKIEAACSALAWLKCTTKNDLKVREELEVITKEQKNDESSKFSLKEICILSTSCIHEFVHVGDSTWILIFFNGVILIAWDVWDKKFMLPFVDKTLRRAYQIALVVVLAREVCGAVPVLNFAGDIFNLASKDTGLVLTPNQQAMLLGAVQVIGSVLASSVVEKSGRKPLLFLTSLVSGISMCVLGTWFLLRDFSISAPSWIPLVTLCVCIFCDSSGLQPISIVLSGEIFSFKYRGTVMATTMFCASMMDFLQLLFFKPLADAVGIQVSFYFFGIVCLLMAVYVIIIIPETKARCLEDIYKDLFRKKRRIKDKELTGI